MKKMQYLLTILSIAVLILFVVGCGATTYTEERYEREYYGDSENKQSKEGLTIERHELKSYPPELIMKVQRCNQYGQMIVDDSGNPVMVDAYVIPGGTYLEKISITNNTGHVIRLNNTVFVAFDPAGNQIDIPSKDELQAILYQQRPCISTQQLISKLATVKILGRNTELLPNLTTTGYIFYIPTDWKIPGVWKLAIYELPVETDQAGIVKKTVNFEFRSVLKKYIDTYKKEAFHEPVLISTEEIK